MSIILPTQWGNLPLPTTPQEAVPVIARQWACQAGRAINYAGYVFGIQAARNFAKNFPLVCPSFIPLPPDDGKPPAYLPNLGGQCPVPYSVEVRGTWRRADGVTGSPVMAVASFNGPIGSLFQESRPLTNGQYSLVIRFSYGGGQFFDALSVTGGGSDPDNEVFWESFFFSILRRVDGAADNCGDPPIIYVLPPPAPPGIDPPPAPPKLPGGGGTVPIKPPGYPPSAPPIYLPWLIPPIIIPIKPTIAPNFNIPVSVPINIPISFPISVSPTINGTIVVQIDPDGNIRTPPDLLCPCQSDPDSPGGLAPVTTQFDIPYFECGQNKGFKSETIQAVASSIPSGLFDRLLSSSNLAEVGCEVVSRVPVAPVQLTGGNVTGVIGIVSYFTVTDEKVKVVRLKIFPQRVDDFRETTIFQGTGQRLFAVLSWSLENGQGGPAVECWDHITDFKLPESSKKRVVKILLKPGLRWELWDTGDR